MTLSIIQVQAQEMYAVINDGIGTMYYDNEKSNREGTIREVKNGETIFKKDDAIQKVIIDASFANARPTSTAYWFLQSASGESLLQEIVGLEYLNTSNVTDMSYMFHYCKNIKDLNVSHFDTGMVKDMKYMFIDCSGLTSLDVSHFNTSKVTNMECMFHACRNLTALDLSQFDTHNVKDMFSMFSWCISLTNLDLGNFYTSEVTDMQNMFQNCENLTTLNVSHFDTSKVTDMSQMFENCKKLTILDLSNFETSSVKDMALMFDYCINLKSLDMSHFDTNNVTRMVGMFQDCKGLENVIIGEKFTQLPEQAFGFSHNISSFTAMMKQPSAIGSDCFTEDVKANATLYVPKGTKAIYESTEGWKDFKHISDGSDVSQDKEMYIVINDGIATMYYDNEKSNRNGTIRQIENGKRIFTDDDVIQKVIFDESFSNARPTSTAFWFKQNDYHYGEIDISSLKEIVGLEYLNTTDVTDMSSMFYTCNGLTTLDVSHFNTSKVTNMRDMFNGCYSLTTLDVSHFDTSNVTNMYFMFYCCKALRSLDVSHFDTKSLTLMEGMFYRCETLISLDVSNFDTNKVTSMWGVFSGCSSLVGLDLNHFSTHNVKNMNGMFSHCKSLTNLDISNFDTSNVTNTGGMFEGCSGLTTLDLSNFDTSNVTYMKYMFLNCNGLSSLELSNFDTSNVTNMGGMFRYCSGLVSLDVSHFITTDVTDMSSMFEGCSGLTTLDLSHFETRNVTNMRDMFSACNGITTLDLSHFNTSNVTNMGRMFMGCSSLTSLDVSHFDTKNVTYINNMFSGCSSLEKVTIGEKFTQLPEKAFAESDKITTFTALMEQPFAINSNCFTDNVKANATLNVPKGTRATYESTEGWKEFKHISDGSDLEPIDEGDNTDYGNSDINSDTDLNGNVIGNIYYNIADNNGEYSSTEGCIILRKSTTDSDMNDLVGKDIFGEDFKNGFTGIVFMVRAGSGTIKVNAQTVGSMTLKVKIGNSQPFTMELEGKMKASIPYTVTEPTYVYIYGGETTANASGLRAASSDNALKIYGIEWNGESASIESINRDEETKAVIYNLNGQRVDTPSKGIYIKNGKKYLLK